jgi:hypothetical protein
MRASCKMMHAFCVIFVYTLITYIIRCQRKLLLYTYLRDFTHIGIIGIRRAYTYNHETTRHTQHTNDWTHNEKRKNKIIRNWRYRFHVWLFRF